ncbi:MAG TPA: Fe-S cluster assembly protein SufB [Candidatus Nanoarchaeia archaeon]|nr:Fe-S cluster assembly protein SufB [Candidatus Nanoarchaeia archaeon]
MGNAFLETRELLDKPSTLKYAYKAKEGINEEVVREISKDKNEPQWMLDFRLNCLKIFNELKTPEWGPNLSGLDLEKITYYIKPNARKNSKNWDEVPEDIKKVFDRLGIPEAERKALAGVGAQFESEVVYHNLKKDLEKQGIIFVDCDVALKEHEELFKKYFMKCVPPALHKYTALHGAVWSGGTFIYIPKGIKVNMPLQAYFRMNSESMGQFEHTLIIIDDGAELSYIEGCSAPQYNNNSLHAGCVEIFVHKNARMRYSSVENWSKNTYNLNTKRAFVEKNAVMEWVTGNIGSKLSMVYPCSMLKGENSKADHLSIAFANKNQHQDVGAKIYHLAKNTSSTVINKSIAKGGGIASYRGLVHIAKKAINSKSNVRCDALMTDNQSKSDTIPYMKRENKKSSIEHEATVSKIGEEQLFYLMSRGLSEDEARKMIVSGFIEPIIKELPIEYAVEMNKLIEMEMDGSLG